MELLKVNIWFMAKLSTITIMMFTRLLPIRMLASKRSGWSRRC